MPRKSKTALPTYATVAELRAAIAASCREAAAIYRAEADAGLRNAGWWADRLEDSAERNDRLAEDAALADMKRCADEEAA